MRIPLLLFFSFCLSIAPVKAEPTVNCHCFQDRDFDPARPAAADGYFLTAAQNTLFAAVSGIDKKTVVRSKMAGADGAEFWLFWYVSRCGEIPEDRVREARQQGRAWRKVIELLQIPPDRFAPTFTKALLAGAENSVLASRVVDEVLATQCRIPLSVLQALRCEGAGDREVLLAVLLATQGERTAKDYYLTVKNGQESWGGLLSKAQIGAEELEGRVRRLAVQ